MEGMVTPHGKRACGGREIQRILVTGSDGYIGSVLVSLLEDQGYDVRGLDTGFYRAGMLYQTGRPQPQVLTKDIRDVCVDDLRGYDAIVHLAELSNDPVCELDEELTFSINHRGSVHLASQARQAGVRRFIYASSCSVYGAGGDDEKTEASKPNPQTAYARCKLLAERDINALAGESFAPTFLRNATAFGPSPRMRFDIVLNNLAGLAWTQREIRLSSDGTPWRPLVHVADIARAIVETLRAPADAVRSEIFNVGSDDQNYRVLDIADAVSAAFPDCRITRGSNMGDNRSYRVSFRKIREHLPAFACTFDAKAGARQLSTLFQRLDLSRDIFDAPPYTRLRQLKALLRTGQVDNSLHWRSHAFS